MQENDADNESDDDESSSDDSESDDEPIAPPPSQSMGRRGVGAKLFGGEMKPCMCGKKPCRQGSFEADTMKKCKHCKYYFLNTSCYATSWYCAYCLSKKCNL